MPESVLVTGGARGIGRAVVEHLRAKGHVVFCADKDNADSSFMVDVTNEQSVQNLFLHIEESGARLHAMVHCAGVGIFRPLEEMTLDEWNHVINTNLTGAFLCTRAAIRHMKPRGGGRIIHIGSIAGETPLQANGAYGSSKAALSMLTKVINEEHKGDGIRATLLRLGAVYTDVWKSRPEFSRSDMLSVEDVVSSISHVLSQPLQVRVDEVVVMPSKGIL